MRFTSIVSTAVAMTAAVAHLMELPAKRRYEPRLYVRLHRTLYPNFGRTAGPAEAVAVASTGAAAWQLRRGAAGRTTAAAASLLAAAHGLFWSVVQPVNTEMVRWDLDAIPRGWTTWRDRWEFGHAARAVLVTAALATLAWAVLQETSEHPGS